MLDLIQERATTELEPANESRSPQTIAIPAAPKPKSLIGTLFGWLLMFALAGSGWYYRGIVVPWMTNLLGLAGPAAPKVVPPRIIPVVTAIVQQKDIKLSSSIAVQI